MTLKLAIAFGTLLPLFAGNGAKQPVQTTTSERVAFAPGGLVRFDDSYGDLNIEGWDRPEVEIRVTKSLSRYYSPTEREKAAKLLERVRVTQQTSGAELTISTSPRKHRGSVMVEYQVHVPYDSRLAIHHRGGSILVGNVTGDIEATSSRGDILLMLPEKGIYSIDAKSRVGTVSSDFAGDIHVRRYLVGQRYSSDSPAPARRIYLRMGFGGIAIKAVP